MKLKTLLMVAFAFATVTLNTACPQDIAKQVVEQSDLRKEYDDKKNDKANVDHKLWHDYSIHIDPIFKSLQNVDWSAKSTAERTVVRGLLQKYLEINGRLLELSEHKLVKDHVSDLERSQLHDDEVSATAYLNSLSTYEGK